MVNDASARLNARVWAGLSREREARAHEREDIVSMSSVGDCVRKLWAQYRGIPDADPPGPKLLAIFGAGHALEDEIVRLLELGGFAVRRQQRELVGFGRKFLGHIDGEVRANARTDWLLFEAKTANARQFGIASELGIREWRPKYFDQVQIYMRYSELQRCLFVVYNKDTSELYAEVIDFDFEHATELMRKVRTALRANQVPPRPAAAKSKSCEYCKWCGWNEWCWETSPEIEFDD